MAGHPSGGRDERWPIFGPRALELGVHAVASYQLFLHRNDGGRFGALNLYGTRSGAFDPESFELLRETSQRANRKLRDVAGLVADTGELP